MTDMLPQTLQKIKNFFKRLPGVGDRTSERFLFELLRWKPEEVKRFSELLAQFRDTLFECPSCGALAEQKCPYCSTPSRNQTILCVVPTAREIFSIESTRCYEGLYHVLGGTLSPLDPPDRHILKVEKLKERIEQLQVKEIFLAFDATLEGDATAHFLRHELAPLNVKFTRPAFGLPIGSPLEGIDMGTLAKAFTGRSSF